MQKIYFNDFVNNEFYWIAIAETMKMKDLFEYHMLIVIAVKQLVGIGAYSRAGMYEITRGILQENAYKSISCF